MVGKAIRESEVPREDTIVASKLPGRHHQYDQARVTIEDSVARMGLDYIDLYLIHWPNPSQGQFVEAWQALVDAQKQGIVKHIGVSNFLPGHIDLLIRSIGVTPAVNQVELCPFFQQAGQRAYDQAHGIITEAWSPLGRANQMLKDPTIVRIAAKHDVPPPRRGYPALAPAARRRGDPEVDEPRSAARQSRPDRVRARRAGDARHRRDGQSRGTFLRAGPALARGSLTARTDCHAFAAASAMHRNALSVRG